MDRLSTLLSQFSVSAGLFHSGGYCGVTTLGEKDSSGHLHFLRQGKLEVWLANKGRTIIEQPSLIFFPRAIPHRFQANEIDQAELVCATLDFDGGADNPIVLALPNALILPLSEIPSIEQSLSFLFDEAFKQLCGRVALLNRLFEVILIQILRHVMETRSLSSGLLSGLADAHLAPVLTQIHDAPEQTYTLESLALDAGMSRARFARHFHQTVGQTVGDYLLSWRLTLAQKKLRQGFSMKQISGEVGYESASALARAFRRKTGLSPSDWLKQQSAVMHSTAPSGA